MKKRIGIIGLGDIAQKVYLPLLSTNESVHIVGINSRTPDTVERIASQYRIKGRFDTVDGLLAEEPEAVFVHSPTETHYDVVMACLKKKVAVYVDKPLSYAYHESEAMAQYALDQGLVLGVGFNRRFAPLYVQARKWLEEAGGFDFCTVSKHRTKLQKHSAKFTLYDDMIHMLDLMLWLGGDHFENLQYIESKDEEGKLLFGTGSLVFPRSVDGLETIRAGQFSMARLAGADHEKLELHGSGRSAEVTNMESAVFSEKNSSPQSGGFGSWETIISRRGFTGAVHHFLEHLDDAAACTIRADRVLPVHQMIERMIAHL
ncbi:Gfo/Idh/MocA family protein [Paenibacillus sp. UNC451MF]|uniref:Gfo/Idh/MocA family protein n=1 Tax=Paenibacillus sp. UNC451MF TaxID=1449063 RepID=UPI00048C36E9|nr:Gfo/Idh/MocA family oxidoreductase [Paenibacillus sp. UNC451MF]